MCILNNVVGKLKYIFVSLIGLVAYGAQSHLTDSIRVTTGDVRVDYCDSGAGLAVASIHIKVRIANRTSKDLILSRQLGPDENVKVADNTGAVVYSPHPSYYETKKGEFGNVPDEKTFEFLKPDTSVERDFIVGLPVSKDRRRLIDSAPPPGKYYVSAFRSAWPFYSDEARAALVRQKWSGYGLLVTAPIKVAQIQIQIDPPDHMRSCDSGNPDAMR